MSDKPLDHHAGGSLPVTHNPGEIVPMSVVVTGGADNNEPFTQATSGGGYGAAQGARIHHKYLDRVEDAVGVIRNDLEEIRDLGTIHQVLFGTGMFFFSGAFWEMIRSFSEQSTFSVTPWMLMYGISMVAGGVLAGAGGLIFRSKQKRLKKYFPD